MHFPFFSSSSPDINRLVQQARQTPGALLIDVRTPEEHENGHIPGSLSLELGREKEATRRIPDRQTPLYVYCLSGGRSASACAAYRRLGYTHVQNIGGILDWNGDIETGAAAPDKQSSDSNR